MSRIWNGIVWAWSLVYVITIYESGRGWFPDGGFRWSQVNRRSP